MGKLKDKQFDLLRIPGERLNQDSISEFSLGNQIKKPLGRAG